MPKTILVVDDTADIRGLLRTYLETWDYAVIEAIDGQSALVAVAAESPDLIILDHHMPGMSGLTALSKLRESGNKTPVIMLTADPNQGTAVQCFRAGADDFLSKPFDPDYLEMVIWRTLKRHEESEKLRVMETALEAERLAAELKNRLLANLGHETGTGIHQVQSHLNFATKSLLEGNTEQATTDIDRANKAVARFYRLLSRLAQLAKLEAGAVELHRQSVQFDLIVKMAIEPLDSTLLGKNIHPRINVPSLKVSVDVRQLTLAFVEIVVNAVELSPNGGQLVILATEAAGEITLTVADSGPGIPESELETVFSPFTESTRTRSDAGGVGLGLTIARRIIAGHGGTITASNNKTGGAIFTITLPLNQHPACTGKGDCHFCVEVRAITDPERLETKASACRQLIESAGGKDIDPQRCHLQVIGEQMASIQKGDD